MKLTTYDKLVTSAQMLNAISQKKIMVDESGDETK